jgi:hypothetical protein
MVHSELAGRSKTRPEIPIEKNPTGNTDRKNPTGNTDRQNPTGNTDRQNPTGNTDRKNPTGNSDRKYHGRGYSIRFEKFELLKLSRERSALQLNISSSFS